MSTDYRALCAELTEKLHKYTSLYEGHESELVNRARAALAQPEPVGVTLANGEIQEWADSSWVVPLQEQRHDGDDWRICFTHEEFCDAIREALSRWGNPTIQPERDESVMDRLIAAPMDSRGYVDLRPGRAVSAQSEPEGVTDDEIDEETATLIPWLLEKAMQAADSDQPCAAGRLTLAAQLLGERRPTIQPVPGARKPVVDYSRVPEIATEAQIRSAAQYLVKKRNCAGDLVPAIEYAIARWGRPTIQPVLVSERLPEPEDCDSEGKCWMLYRSASVNRTPTWSFAHRRCILDAPYSHWLPANAYSHWLPPNALPTPEVTNV